MFRRWRCTFERPRVPDQTTNQLSCAISKVEQRLNMHLMGIDPIQYLRFMQSTPAIQYSLAGTWQAQSYRDYKNATGAEFTSCYEFVVESSLAASVLSKAVIVDDRDSSAAPLEGGTSN